MRTATRIVSMMVLLTIVLGSALAASPMEPSLDSEIQALFTPSVALAPDGSVWAAWVADTGDDREIVTARWDGRTWQPIEMGVPNPGRWDAAPSLAVDASGVVWLAWSSSTGKDDMLHVSHWTERGWSTPQDVPAQDTMPNRQPVLAPAPDGGLWLAWVGFDGNDDEIYAAFWDGVTWSEPQRVSRDDTDPAAYDTQPRLAVGPDGTVWVAWTSHEKFLDSEILAARWDGQRWTAEEQVSADDDMVNASPSLAVAEDGTAWLAWHGRASDTFPGRRIYVRRWDEAMGWDTETIVSSPLESAVTEERPSMALDTNGLPHVIWHVNDGESGIGYAAFDGSDWSSPTWIVQDAVVEGVALVDGDKPSVTWWPADPSATLPSHSWDLNDAADLPIVAAPDQSPTGILIVTNRHLAFGDSITWGLYDDPATGEPVGAYPSRLEEMLDSRVTPSEVINDGVPGERTAQGKWRLLDASWPTYLPEFIELMEGTNDITGDKVYDNIAENLSEMVKWTKKGGSLPLLATLIPRRDDRNDETRVMNSYIAEVATARGVPLVDNWQAFYDYGDWRSLFIDIVHPNAEGMAILSQSWYDNLLASAWWLSEDTTPPTTWIESLPAQSECEQVMVNWNGSDDVSWVTDYDVQVKLNNWPWMDWLVAIEDTSGIYTGGSYGDILGFQVRGRDLLGNESEYSTPLYTQITDNEPPYWVQVLDLPPVRKAPFVIRWLGADSCGAVSAFDAEYRVGLAGDWQLWQSATPDSSAAFDPASPQYGETYYFRVRARDQAGNWSYWSAPVSTILARFVLSGDIVTIRHEPVLWAEVSVPDVLATATHFGGYRAYLKDEGDYELSVTRDGFGMLPPMHAISVTTDMSGLDFVLPPLDDAVGNGGFEASDWGDWQPGGSVTPTIVTETHTGDGAALLGGIEGASWISQTLSVPSDLTDATLSFLVRLDDDADGSSDLYIELAGTPISHTQVVSAGGWTHVWFPADVAVGEMVTLTFAISGSPAVRLDEISVGSAIYGGSVTYLPLILRDY